MRGKGETKRATRRSLVSRSTRCSRMQLGTCIKQPITEIGDRNNSVKHRPTSFDPFFSQTILVPLGLAAFRCAPVRRFHRPKWCTMRSPRQNRFDAPYLVDRHGPSSIERFQWDLLRNALSRWMKCDLFRWSYRRVHLSNLFYSNSELAFIAAACAPRARVIPNWIKLETYILEPMI